MALRAPLLLVVVLVGAGMAMVVRIPGPTMVLRLIKQVIRRGRGLAALLGLLSLRLMLILFRLGRLGLQVTIPTAEVAMDRRGKGIRMLQVPLSDQSARRLRRERGLVDSAAVNKTKRIRHPPVRD